jgi:ribosomal protein S18 acetylase RimI-like enzyme
MQNSQPTFRQQVTSSDRDAVRRIVEATRFFRPDEIEVAVELVDERLARDEASGYEFIFMEREGSLVGYACFGKIACTLGSYDLYWIAVEPNWQGRGLGQRLLGEVECHIRQRGGRHIYIETSSRPQYAPTRSYYERCGYEVVAELPDFYDFGDSKVIWRKVCGHESD